MYRYPAATTQSKMGGKPIYRRKTKKRGGKDKYKKDKCKKNKKTYRKRHY